MPPFFIYHLIKIVFVFTLVFCGVLFLLKYYFSGKKEPLNPSAGNAQKIILPLRLQAYERIVLFLERINPSVLVMRLNRPELSATELQSLLLKTIRDEFEYNLSQQLYISLSSWEMIRNAKEETIRLINTTAGKMNEHAASADLVRAILEASLEKEKLPVSVALEEVKKEIQRLF